MQRSRQSAPHICASRPGGGGSTLRTHLRASWTAFLSVSTIMVLSSCDHLRIPSGHGDRSGWRLDYKYRQLAVQEIDLLRHLTRCLDAYSGARAGFPAALDAIGPAGTRCADADVVEDRLPTLSVQYRPGPHGRNGLATSYLVDLRSRGFRSIHMRSDETGVQYSFVGSKAVSHPDLLCDYLAVRIAMAAERYCSAHPSSGYPTTIAELRLSDVVGESAASLEAGRLDGTRYTYSPGERGQDGRVSRYRLEVRPIRYRHPSVESYLVTSDRRIWATDQDRAAGPGDTRMVWYENQFDGIPPCNSAPK
jgi:hypothetical protein